MAMLILVTGGAGYIGSHTIIELITSGHDIIAVDDLSNSSIESIRRVEEITKISIPFHKFDVRNKAKLTQLFDDNHIEAVIHFAGLKSVGESVAYPVDYYRTNIDSTLSLLEVMNDHNVKKLIFSSSATVYGDPSELPLRETSRIGVGITNPYGWTKFMIEQMLRDVTAADSDMQISLLRYFNPVGAHESGMIGEDPNDIPNNLMPFIAQVAVGKLPEVRIFGDDYDTIDGTGVRDYIHVVDLAKGHVAALDHLHAGIDAYNLATGAGTSVLQLIEAFKEASGRDVPYQIVDRRPGDIAACYASPEKANRELGWFATKKIEDACADSWRWQSLNPDGFNS